VRAAFPDAFNDRAKTSLDKLTDRGSSVAKSEDLISGVYFLMTDQELPDNQAYEVTMYATVPVTMFDNPENRAAAQKVFDTIETALDSCEGIEIVESELVSEQDFTLDQINKFGPSGIIVGRDRVLRSRRGWRS
jgi:hypothetical protein